jgi:hypothetical protein
MGHGIPQVTAQIDIARDPFLFESGHSKSMRAAYTGGAEFHHSQHMPRHFQPFAKSKYGYKPRTKKYNARKLKIVGHQIDNVFTGRSKTEITTKHKVQSTAKGAKLKMKLPITGGTGRLQDDAARARLFAAGKAKTQKITGRQISSQKTIIERVAEMKVISGDEHRTVAKVAKVKYVEQANMPTTRRRIRISSK